MLQAAACLSSSLPLTCLWQGPAFPRMRCVHALRPTMTPRGLLPAHLQALRGAALVQRLRRCRSATPPSRQPSTWMTWRREGPRRWPSSPTAKCAPASCARCLVSVGCQAARRGSCCRARARQSTPEMARPARSEPWERSGPARRTYQQRPLLPWHRAGGARPGNSALAGSERALGGTCPPGPLQQPQQLSSSTLQHQPTHRETGLCAQACPTAAIAPRAVDPRVAPHDACRTHAGLLAVQLAVTTVLGAACVFSAPVRAFLNAYPVVPMSASLGALVILLVFAFSESARSSHPTNLWLLLGFTVCESVRGGGRRRGRAGAGPRAALSCSDDQQGVSVVEPCGPVVVVCRWWWAW